jgi:hypothetical protein
MCSMKFKLPICTIVLFVYTSNFFCQTSTADSAAVNDLPILSNEKKYDVGNGKVFIYTKPKPFSFLTNLPKDFIGISKAPFKKML